MTTKIAKYPLFQEKLDGVMPDADVEWLAAEIVVFWARHVDDYEFCDNHRLALKGHAESEAVYDEQLLLRLVDELHDTEFGPSPSGRTYLYGFNLTGTEVHRP